jgi:hypothetical protein
MNTTEKAGTLIKTFNLKYTVHFATRIPNYPEYIFISCTRLSYSSEYPIIHNLTDHDAQYLMNNSTVAADDISLKDRTSKTIKKFSRITHFSN